MPNCYRNFSIRLSINLPGAGSRAVDPCRSSRPSESQAQAEKQGAKTSRFFGVNFKVQKDELNHFGILNISFMIPDRLNMIEPFVCFHQHICSQDIEPRTIFCLLQGFRGAIWQRFKVRWDMVAASTGPCQLNSKFLGYCKL